MKNNQPKTFYGYKIDASQPFELQIHLPLDYDVKEGQVIRIGEEGVAIAVADTPAEKRISPAARRREAVGYKGCSFIISGAFFCLLSTKEVKVKIGDYLGCDLDNANVVDLNAPNSLPLYRVDGINYPQDGSNPILFISFTQPVHP